MARFFESRQDRVSREARQRARYPQREFATFDEIAEVDAAERTLANEPLTQFGRDAEDTFVRNFSGSEDEELAAPRGPVVGPPPLPSPFDIARFRRTQGLDEPDGGGGLGLGDIGGFLGRAGRLAADSPIAAGVTAVPRSILGVGSELAQGDFSGAAGALPGAGLLRTARDPVGAIDRTVGGALETARAGSPPTQIVDLLGREREPAQTTAEGVRGLLGGLQDIDRIGGLPFRAVNRQGVQAFREPGQALREQFALDQQGGLGFGLEGSAAAEQLRRVPGIEQDVFLGLQLPEFLGGQELGLQTEISTFDFLLAAADVGLDVGGLVAAIRATPRATRGIRAFSQLTDGVPVGASVRNVGPDDDLLKQLQASIDELGSGNEVFRATDRNTGRYIRRHANDFTEDPAEAMLFNSEASARAFEEANPSSTLDFWTVRAVAGVDESPDVLRSLPDRPAPQLTDRPVPPSTVPVQPGAIPRAIPEAPVVPRVADQGAVPRVADEIVPPAAPSPPTGITPAPRGGAGAGLPGGPPVPPRAAGAGLPGAPEPGRAPSQVTIDPLRNVPPLKPYEPSITTPPPPRGPSPALPSRPGQPPRVRPPELPGGGRVTRAQPPNLEQFTDQTEAVSRGRQVFRTFSDIINFPRAVMSSIDHSFPGRQGLPFTTRSAWWRAWGPSFRAWLPQQWDDWATRRQDMWMAGPETRAAAAAGDFKAIKAVAAAERRAEHGLSQVAFGELAQDLSMRDEGFISRWADKIPWINASQRSYVTFGLELRSNLFDEAAARADRWVQDGAMTAAQRTEYLNDTARWINIGTGRAALTERVATSDLLAASGATVFSPRHQISRFQALGEVFRMLNVTGKGPGSKMVSQMRRELARDITGFVGQGMLALWWLDAMGWVEVELDPRSTDFGKGRVPITGQRYDPWAGFQPIARYVAQLWTEQSKNATTGEITDLDKQGQTRLDTAGKFGRSKLGPIPSLFVDLATGETQIGEPVGKEQVTDPAWMGRRFMPLTPDDILMGAEAEGLTGGLKSAPAIFGIGFNQYQTSADVLDAVSLEVHGKLYRELNKGEKETVEADQRVLDKRAENREDPLEDVSFEEAAFVGARFDKTKADLEAETRALIDGGLAGEALHDELGVLKFKLHVAGQTAFEDLFEQDPDDLEKEQTEDIIAERYWSVEAPESVTAAGDKRIDFDSQELERAEILEQAGPLLVSLGLDLDYITGRGEGTYRGQRYDDEVVREAVFADEALRDTMRDTGFWDLRDQAWIAFRDQHFDKLGDIPDYWAWRENEVYNETQRLISEGEVPPIARDRAEAIVSQYQTVSQFNEFYRTQFRHGWVVRNRPLAQQAVGLGYLSPDKAEGKFLSEVTEEPSGFQPLDISGGRGIPQAPSFSGAIDIRAR